MNIPFYKVFLQKNGKRDITQFVEGISFESHTEKDDIATIKIFSNRVRQFDQLELERGNSLELQFGLIKGLRSDLIRLRVTDIQFDYGETIRVTVTALDKGTVMKKSNGGGKVWQKKTTGAIIREIAGRYNLGTEIEYEGQEWESLVQGNENDFEFLQQVSQKEKEGNFVVFVSDEKIHFVKRGIDKKSNFLFEYGNQNSGVISFKPKEKESTLEPTAISPKVSQTENAVKVEDGNNVTLGRNKYTYNAESLGRDADLGKTVVEPGKDVKVAENRLKSATKAATLEGMEASLTLLGRPDIKVNTVITMAGVFKRHLGNYLVVGVRHTLDSSAMKTELELKKNGQETTGGGAPVAAKENKTKGSPGTVAETVKVKVYDADGNPTTKPNASTYN